MCPLIIIKHTWVQIINSLKFLEGGGEMGALMRNKDWNHTSLGPPHTWPASLRTTLGILLHSKFPMFLFWGAESICFYNDAYRPSLGNDGKHPFILGQKGETAWPEIWSFIKPQIDQVMQGGEATWYEDQFLPIYRNGKIEDVYWTFSYSPVIDQIGNIAAVFVTCSETTGKFTAQAELRESEQKFRLLANNMPQLVWTANTTGQFNYFNDSVQAYLGETADERLAARWLQSIHPAEREAYLQAWQQAVTNGDSFIFEHRLQKQDGSWRWHLCRAVPQKNKDGQIHMWVGTCTDIEDLKEADQQKNYFIRLASHELQTPVTTLKAYVQLLQERYAKSPDIFLKKGLEVLGRQTEQQIKLITELLDLSKIKTGNLTLRKRPFLVNQFLRDIIQQNTLLYADYSFVFSNESSIHNNITIAADQERLSQVLTNLLSNAVKYSPQNKQIHINAAFNTSEIIISVHDFGIGIPAALQEKIFERFYRVEDPGQESVSGFGIGLFISSEIIKRHGGRIWVTSQAGRGSVFYFSLPVAAI